MATGERKYFDYLPFDRPKIARNKYGLVNTSTINNGGNSLFAGGSSGSSSENVVGGAFVDISKFTGATATEDGTQGLVPAPVAGQNLNFLQGSGGWVDIPAYRWLKEYPEGEGFQKSGLTINGDFNVAKTLSTLNLKVEGSAHFWELLIDEVRASGGQLLVSPSRFHVDWVGDIVYYDTVNISEQNLLTIFKERPDIYNAIKNNDIVSIKAVRLYQRNDDNTKRIRHEVEFGDMLRCRTFNIEEGGEYRDVKNTDYWTFVVKTGDGIYKDNDGIDREALWIDIAYALKPSVGPSLPIGTTFTIDGSVTPIKPEGYSETSDILELKKVSQQVLSGEFAGQEESLDGQELIDVQNKVIQIRGLSDAVNNISGRYSTNSLNANNLSQVNKQLAVISGKNPDINAEIGEENLTQRIIDGLMSSSVPQPLNDTDKQIALKRSSATVSRVDINDTARYDLDVDYQQGNKITIKEDTVLERDFVLAEDVLDDNGSVIPGLGKGDKVDVGVVIDKPIVVIDKEVKDEVTKIDIETGDLSEPENLTEINDFTTDTPSGVNRDSGTEGVDYSKLTSWLFGYGTFSCNIGDDLACLGNLYDIERQNAIVLSSFAPIDPDLVAPAIAQYNNIDRFGESISNFRLTAIAANGNEFAGTFLINHDNKYVDVNERIELFINDLESGLESVGIHLDGQNSSIKLVGTVDLKQHSNTDYDTLNVYDNLEIKRVEITPQSIPARLSKYSDIADTTKKNFTTAQVQKNATSAYISKDHHGGLFGHKYKTFKLSNYSINYTINCNLGRIEANTRLDLRNLDLTLYTNIYFNGSTKVTDRGNGTQQNISSLTYTLKRDGVVYVDKYNIRYENISIISLSNLGISGLSSDTINIRTNGAMADDIPIHVGGTYTIELKMNAFLYAFYETKDDYKNYYYRVNTTLIGNITTYTIRTNVADNDFSNRKITIGNNGLSFVGNNSRYFYAATDGFYILFDDYSLSIDNNGVRKNGSFNEIKKSTNLTIKDDVVIAKKPNNGVYTVYLPPLKDYGVGRQIFISGYRGMILQPVGSDKISYTDEDGTQSINMLTFGTSPLLKFTVTLCAGVSEWYIMSYL